MTEAVYCIEKPKRLCAAELIAVSNLYRSSIPQSFLARLEPSFFSKLLSYGLTHSFCSILLLRNTLTNAINGFIIFTNCRGWMKKTMYRHKARFLLEGMKNIFNKPVCAYLVHGTYLRLFGKKQSGKTLSGPDAHRPRMELFVIAVSEPLRGRGWGKKLIKAFEDELLSLGHSEYAVMTLDANSASNSLYRGIGARLVATHENPNGPVNEYVKTLDNNS